MQVLRRPSPASPSNCRRSSTATSRRTCPEPNGEQQAPRMATVVYSGVTHRYPGADRPAVTDLHLEIGDGEFLVLVGPSGCGKSTSLRMLAGLAAVEAGHIEID